MTEAPDLSPDDFRELVDQVLVPRVEDFHRYVAGAAPDPLPVARGFGVLLWDDYGRQYLDMTAGGGALLLGHCHEAQVVGPHAQLAVYSTSAATGRHVWARQVELAKALSGRFPPDEEGRPRKVLFTNSGREALAVASMISGRPPINPAPAPHCEPPTPVWAAEEAFRTGKAGFPVVVDETRTGYGRMGTFCAHEQLGFTADVTVLGDLGGGGLPFGAVVAGERWLGGLSPAQFACGPVVAIAALGLLEHLTPDVLRHAVDLGEALRQGLQSVADQFGRGVISGVRGWGTLRSLMLVEPRAEDFRVECLRRGLVVDAPAESVVLFSPALVASLNDAGQAADVVAEVCLEWAS